MSEKEILLTPRVVIKLVFFIVLIPMMPLIISWQWDWWEGWLYALCNILGFILSRYLAWHKNPDLLAERGKFGQHDNTEPFDKVLSPLMGLLGGTIPIVAGLEARFGTGFQLGTTIKLLSVLIYLSGWVLGSYALIENRFFSGMVRIQTDRGQHVIDTGPYRGVRHPGYSGALLTYIGTPFLLNSWWSIIPIALTIVLITLRTGLEDKTLQEKLEGYQIYTQKVRYRLIPGIW